MDNDLGIKLSERVAVLETKLDGTVATISSIESKLDQLLDLKAKGTGAFQLVGLILGSGIIGVIGLILSVFSPKSHL